MRNDFLLPFAIALTLGGIANANAPTAEQSVALKSQREYAHVRAAFTPGENIAAIINEEIRAARSTVQVQAYLFTSKAIADALLAAVKRGVMVEVIVDAAEYENGNAPVLPRLARAGVRVFLNDKHKSSHNKIIIIDAELQRATIITGSYNFTRSAQTLNAENVVVMSGNPELARRFHTNWQHHRTRSIPLQ